MLNKVSSYGEKIVGEATITILIDTNVGALYFIKEGKMLGQMTRSPKIQVGGLYLSVYSNTKLFWAEIVTPPQDLRLSEGVHGIFYALDINPSIHLTGFLKEYSQMEEDERAKVGTVVRAVLANPRRTHHLAASMENPQDRPSKDRLLYELAQLSHVPELENPDFVKDPLFKKAAQIQESLHLKRVSLLTSVAMYNDLRPQEKTEVYSEVMTHLMATPIRAKEPDIPSDPKKLFLLKVKSVGDKPP